MAVKKLTMKKIIVLKNDNFNETIIVKYNRKKNVRMKNKNKK
jgi:hypothetical protein